MSRATVVQLKQLGLDSYALAQIPSADLQIALDAAADWIDGVIAPQFPPPILAPFPMDLIECECIRASWTALTVKGYRPTAQSGMVDQVKARYDEWIGPVGGDGWVWRVARGETVPKIHSAAADETDAGASGPSVITETQRGFSERGIDRFSTPRPNTDPFSGD